MLYVNSSIPAVETLRAEGLDVVVAQPAGVPRIGLLNLMPEKVATEYDYCRMLAQSGLTLSVVLLRLPGETYKTTPQSYVEAHYEVLGSASRALSQLRLAQIRTRRKVFRHLPARSALARTSVAQRVAFRFPHAPQSPHGC